ncbi:MULTISPECIES: hypothetical protein [unclassified Streptomyces]|uniref:hypothetical protein n=1 Tax=unclassified Streptomyces TaxID=2593676 RepID=UPI00336A23BF
MPATPPSKDKARNAGTPPARDRPDSTAGHRAAAYAERLSTGRLDLPLIGAITFPPRKQLVFYAGLCGLATAGVIEWPVAAAVGLGHLLATSHSNETIRNLGEVLEEA